MSRKKLELSRRKTLAALGAIGAASAGAGLGTSALFNDQESFENNRLVAGALDLKMDWEEHYSTPQLYGLGDPADGLDVRRTDPIEDPNLTPAEAAKYTGLPDPQDPVVWVHDDDFDEYFQRTTIEAYPDRLDEEGPIQAQFWPEQPCETLADIPGDLGAYADEQQNGLGRTRNGDTYDDVDGPLPLINLTDVKPGDYGEFTFSAHLCYNDGYLWLRMPGGLQESGGDTTEPEEVAMNAGATDDGELAENVQTTLWYDDGCSNTINGEPEPLIAMALVDTSGTIDATEMQTIADASNAFVEQLNGAPVDVHAGVMTFSGDDVDEANTPKIILQNDVELLQNGSAYLDGSGNGRFIPGSHLLPSEGDGQTPLAPALDLAREVLNDRAQSLGLPNARKTILVISDGQPSAPLGQYYLVDANGNPVNANGGSGSQFVSDYFDGLPDFTPPVDPNAEALLVARDIDTGPREDANNVEPDDISGTDGITIRTVGLGANTSSLNTFMTNLATRPGLFYNSSITQDLIDLTNDIIDDLNVLAGEEVIYRGTLDGLAAEMPIPLDGDPNGDDFDELADPDDHPNRQPFDASATQCFGLAWWVDESVGNVIQGDSVSFDLGFYTEQARHNENPGQTMGGS